MGFKQWYVKPSNEGGLGEKKKVVESAPVDGLVSKVSPVGGVHGTVLEHSLPGIPSAHIHRGVTPSNGNGFGGTSTGLDIISTQRAIQGARSFEPVRNMHEVAPNYYQSEMARVPVYKAIPRGIQPSRGPRVRFFDPLSLVYATGFRDRRYSLSYDILRRTSYQLSLVAAIIVTRVNQVASFSHPHRENRQIGFQVRFKDEMRVPTEEERKVIQRLEQFVLECGWGHNPYCPFPRDNFWAFLKKVVRDSLTYDQMCFEVVPDSEGRPYEFRAVDASTIRLAATFDGYRGEKSRSFQSKEFSDRWTKEYGENFELDGQGVYSVQVIHGRIENIFTYHDMAFAIRNPRADVWVNGYGFAEIEMCLNTVMRQLWAEEYNARNFQQGSMANGILNFKGDNFSPEQLEAFKRVWQAQVAGVENAHRIPLIQVPEGVEFVNLGRGNKEMEYKAWLEYLIKIVSGAFQIDPSEVNFDLVSGAGGGRTPMFENKHEWKIKFSKDKGLRPLLKFVAEAISRHVIDPLDSRFYLDFVGLDHLSEKDRIELLSQRTSSYLTINEARREEGLDPLPGGDIVNNPTFFQAYQAASADTSQSQAKSPFAPWRTAGDIPELEYGQAPPVPLYLQMGDEMLSGQQEQGQQGDMGGMGGGDMGGGDMGGGGGFPM